MKYTSGPWKFDNELGCKSIKGDKRGKHRQAQYKEIAYTVGLYDEDEDKANARLIAAAPELLDALKAVEWTFPADSLIRTCPWCRNGQIQGHATDCQRQQAIAKATRKEPK